MVGGGVVGGVVGVGGVVAGGCGSGLVPDSEPHPAAPQSAAKMSDDSINERKYASDFIGPTLPRWPAHPKRQFGTKANALTCRTDSHALNAHFCGDCSFIAYIEARWFQSACCTKFGSQHFRPALRGRVEPLL